MNEERLSNNERLVLQAMASRAEQGASRKCAAVLRHALKAASKYTDAAEFAICNTGYEDPDVGELYDALRHLALSRFPGSPLVRDRGDLQLPAGPRYTECDITAAGLQFIAADPAGG